MLMRKLMEVLSILSCLLISLTSFGDTHRSWTTVDHPLGGFTCVDLKTNNNRITTTYKKSADIALLTNNLGLIPTRYKFDFLKKLINCWYKLNNPSICFHNEMEKIKIELPKNLLQSELIDTVLKNYLIDQFNSNWIP